MAFSTSLTKKFPVIGLLPPRRKPMTTVGNDEHQWEHDFQWTLISSLSTGSHENTTKLRRVSMVPIRYKTVQCRKPSDSTNIPIGCAQGWRKWWGFPSFNYWSQPSYRISCQYLNLRLTYINFLKFKMAAHLFDQAYDILWEQLCFMSILVLYII